jgi:hypothetical protein
VIQTFSESLPSTPPINQQSNEPRNETKTTTHQTPVKMFRKPSSHLQPNLPLLALLALALVLSIATLACAATTLHLFESQQSTNPWLLPVWRSHFDLRGLKLVVGTSAAMAVFDFVAMGVLVGVAVQVRSLYPSFVWWSCGLLVIEDAKSTFRSIPKD